MARVIGGGYRVERLLARGKTTSRFEVSHPDIRGMLSMKAFTTVRSPAEASAIVEQARAVSALRGPHIARVIDAGYLEGGEPFVITDHLLGTDLATLVRCGSPLSIADAVSYACQICRGVSEAHAAGIIHGDLDLRHVVLVPDAGGKPYVRIIDFVGSNSHKTPLDDVRAIGVILHALVTGRATSDTPILPRALDLVVRSCLAGDFPTPMALFAALTSFAMEVSGARSRLAATMLVRRPPAESTGMLRLLALAALGPIAALLTMTAVKLVYSYEDARPKAPVVQAR